MTVLTREREGVQEMVMESQGQRLICASTANPIPWL